MSSADFTGLGRSVTAEERFMAKLTIGDGCWAFDGYHDKDGYPSFSFKKRSVRATRFAYEMFVGPVPADLCVCHSCDNPSCVNPDHLWLGTTHQNNTDRSKKGRDSRHSFGGWRNAPRDAGGKFIHA